MRTKLIYVNSKCSDKLFSSHSPYSACAYLSNSDYHFKEFVFPKSFWQNFFVQIIYYNFSQCLVRDRCAYSSQVSTLKGRVRTLYVFTIESRRTFKENLLQVAFSERKLQSILYALATFYLWNSYSHRYGLIVSFYQASTSIKSMRTAQHWYILAPSRHPHQPFDRIPAYNWVVQIVIIKNKLK